MRQEIKYWARFRLAAGHQACCVPLRLGFFLLFAPSVGMQAGFSSFAVSATDAMESDLVERGSGESTSVTDQEGQALSLSFSPF